MNSLSLPRAGHDAIQMTLGDVTQAEDLTADLGEPFAASLGRVALAV
jgi:hypothetical protein